MGRIENAINEYFKRKNKNKGCFYLGDFIELLEMSNGKYELMFNSLNAGYIIGYRTAKREIKKNEKK